MTNTNKLEGRLMLVIDGELQRGTYNTMTGLEEGLARMIAEDADKKEELKEARIEVLNVVGEVLDSRHHFKLDFLQDDPYIGNEQIGDEIECEYKVGDTGRTFSDLDDLEDYLKDLIKDGEYTVAEVKDFEIHQTITQEISFDHIDEGEIEVEVEYNEEGTHIANSFARAFYNADLLNIGQIVHEEMEKQLADTKLVNLERNIGEMTLDAIDLEMATLQDRMMKLLAEKKHRQEIKGTEEEDLFE